MFGSKGGHCTCWRGFIGLTGKFSGLAQLLFYFFKLVFEIVLGTACVKIGILETSPNVLNVFMISFLFMKKCRSSEVEVVQSGRLL